MISKFNKKKFLYKYTKTKNFKKSKCNQKTEKLFLINISISYLSTMI